MHHLFKWWLYDFYGNSINFHFDCFTILLILVAWGQLVRLGGVVVLLWNIGAGSQERNKGQPQQLSKYSHRTGPTTVGRAGPLVAWKVPNTRNNTVHIYFITTLLEFPGILPKDPYVSTKISLLLFQSYLVSLLNQRSENPEKVIRNLTTFFFQLLTFILKKLLGRHKFTSLMGFI